MNATHSILEQLAARSDFSDSESDGFENRLDLKKLI